MYVTLDIETLDIYNIYFSEKQKNNVIQNCFFSNIYYSTLYYTLNNLVFFLEFEFTITCPEKNQLYFNTNNPHNTNIMHHIQHIEKQLLTYYKKNTNELQIQYTLYPQLKKGYIKLIMNTTVKKVPLLLRISGIWENKQGEIGLIYKFLKANSANMNSNKFVQFEST